MLSQVLHRSSGDRPVEGFECTRERGRIARDRDGVVVGHVLPVPSDDDDTPVGDTLEYQREKAEVSPPKRMGSGDVD